MRIIDFDTVFGPKLLQPAVLFASCFLVSSIMYRSAYLSLSDLEKVIEYWPEPLNRQDLLVMMQVFPIVLGLKTEHAFRRFPEYNKERYQSNTRLIMWCLENIWKWI